MKYLKAKWVGKQRYQAEWNAASEAYRQHFREIVGDLPESAQAFVRHIRRSTLHDAAVLSITRCGRHDLHVDLDCRRLEFIAVRNAKFPQPLEEATVWLYDELDSAPGDRFELCALFDSGELGVVAQEIRVFDKYLSRYVIPNEPAPEPSTLFLDRKHKKRKRKR